VCCACPVAPYAFPARFLGRGDTRSRRFKAELHRRRAVNAAGMSMARTTQERLIVARRPTGYAPTWWDERSPPYRAAIAGARSPHRSRQGADVSVGVAARRRRSTPWCKHQRQARSPLQRRLGWEDLWLGACSLAMRDDVDARGWLALCRGPPSPHTTASPTFAGAGRADDQRHGLVAARPPAACHPCTGERRAGASVAELRASRRTCALLPAARQ
jgi:hypothetical protein